MVVHRRKATQPWPLGKTRKPKRLGDEPFKLSHVLKINGFDSFRSVFAFWMSFPYVDPEVGTLIVGRDPVAQAPR